MGKKILVAPLDWGLGHTSRCIPIIKALQESEHEVFVAGTKKQAQFISSHQITFHHLPLFGYEVKYSKIWPQWMKVASQSLRIMKLIKKEHQWLQEQIVKHNIDCVISDNRYGLYHKNIKSIFITYNLSHKYGKRIC